MNETQEKESLTRDYIFQAFHQLLQANHYNDISVCNITEKAGVSRMSFYRNFKSKDDLTFKAIEKISLKLKKEFDNNCNLYNITKTLFQMISDNKTIVKSFENSEISKTLIDTAVENLKDSFPYDHINKTNKYLPLYYFGALSRVAVEWFKNNCEETPEEMAKFISGLINEEPHDNV